MVALGKRRTAFLMWLEGDRRGDARTETGIRELKIVAVKRSVGIIAA